MKVIMKMRQQIEDQDKRLKLMEDEKQLQSISILDQSDEISNKEKKSKKRVKPLTDKENKRNNQQLSGVRSKYV